MKKISSKKETVSYITKDGKSFYYEGLAREHELRIAKDRMSEIEQSEYSYFSDVLIGYCPETEEDLQVIQICFPTHKLYKDYQTPIWLYVWNGYIISKDDMKKLIEKEISSFQ